jgi:hypothetical protein
MKTNIDTLKFIVSVAYTDEGDFLKLSTYIEESDFSTFMFGLKNPNQLLKYKINTDSKTQTEKYTILEKTKGMNFLKFIQESIKN